MYLSHMAANQIAEERVNDKMQAGYRALEAGDTQQACRLWLETWRAVLGIIERTGVPSLDDFDDLFGGMQSVFNWVQDFEAELYNAGLKAPEFFHERVALCETMVSRFSGGELPMDGFQWSYRIRAPQSLPLRFHSSRLRMRGLPSSSPSPIRVLQVT